MSRPSEYTQEKADTICGLLSDGMSLRSICRDESMPSVPTVFKWMRDYPEFLNQYARAKGESADAMTEDILEIADDKTEDANSRRVRIDARKWIASKLKPKKYGDKLELAGDQDNPIKHKVEGVISLKKPEST